MKEFNAEEFRVESTSVSDVVVGAEAVDIYSAYVGLDVHKETIAVAVALPGRDEPHYRGEIKHEPQALQRWLKRLSDEFGGAVLLFCYEAGPCGYGLYRQLSEAGHECQVVAPSLIPKKPGERFCRPRIADALEGDRQGTEVGEVARGRQLPGLFDQDVHGTRVARTT